MELASRLRARRSELESALSSRIGALAKPAELEDPEYAESLGAALTAAVDYTLVVVEQRGGDVAPIPPALLVHAHLAARSGVDLDTLLQRCFAGYTLLSGQVVEDAENAGGVAESLPSLIRDLGAAFERLLAALSEEHGREAASRLDSPEKRRVARIERLLAGEILDPAAFQYEFDRFHTGVVAVGGGAGDAIREAAESLNCDSLIVNRERAVWAWLAVPAEADSGEVERVFSRHWSPQLPLALGEPAPGLPGWRLTHRQALAAVPIALRTPGRIVRYADVALTASILRDDLLSASLRQLYLAPLEGERDGGEVLRKTLSAYFAAGRNVSLAAGALNVNRNTVANRLRAIEAKTGRHLASSASGFEAALRLCELGEAPSSGLARSL